MEGVMIRNGEMYGLAVRLPTGDICAQRLRWYSITRKSWLQLPFLRGFPILLETMINGIQALNRSVALVAPEEVANDKFGRWQMLFSLCMALVMAIGLFVVAPHILSVFMLFLGLGGDVEGLSFHLWDGFYKCAIFVLYIWLISFVPDIRRVFEYHGAEHKTICAWETENDVDASIACKRSRLHPRCGTTFLLFVICISIILQAVLVPLLLKINMPQSIWTKHIMSIIIKLFLVVPISAVAYEIIRFASRLPNGVLATILLAPGLALQKLTTREPTTDQLDVAVIALAEALGSVENGRIRTVKYRHLI